MLLLFCCQPGISWCWWLFCLFLSFFELSKKQKQKQTKRVKGERKRERARRMWDFVYDDDDDFANGLRPFHWALETKLCVGASGQQQQTSIKKRAKTEITKKKKRAGLAVIYLSSPTASADWCEGKLQILLGSLLILKKKERNGCIITF